MLTLTEKELGHALFFALKRGDLEHSQYLLSIDAPVGTSYFISQDKIAYTQNLMVAAVAKVVKEVGAAHGKAQQALRIFNKFCEKRVDFRCHCIAKHPHYCAIGEMLKHLPVTCPEGKQCCYQDLQVEEKFLFLVKLLLNGATFKNIGTNNKDYIWTAIQEVQAFIETRRDQAEIINKSNRNTRTLPCKQYRPSTCPKLRK